MHEGAQQMEAISLGSGERKIKKYKANSPLQGAYSMVGRDCENEN